MSDIYVTERANGTHPYRVTIRRDVREPRWGCTTFYISSRSYFLTKREAQECAIKGNAKLREAGKLFQPCEQP